jgi:hypothetical protein
MLKRDYCPFSSAVWHGPSPRGPRHRLPVQRPPVGDRHRQPMRHAHRRNPCTPIHEDTHWLPSATSIDRDGTHRGLGADSQQTLADSFRLHVKPKIRQSEEFYDASSTMARPYQQDRA